MDGSGVNIDSVCGCSVPKVSSLQRKILTEGFLLWEVLPHLCKLERDLPGRMIHLDELV